MGDEKTGTTPATTPITRRSVSNKRLYWGLQDYIKEKGLVPKDDSIEVLLGLLKDDVLEDTR